MPALLLGLFFVAAAITSLIDAHRITSRQRLPGVFDLLGPDRYLVVISVALLALALPLLVVGIRAVRAGPTPRRRREAMQAADGAPLASARRHVWIFVALAAYVVLMPTLGYPFATLAFVSACFYVMGIRDWRANLPSSAVLTAVFFLVFYYGADMPLPRGVLGLG